MIFAHLPERKSTGRQTVNSTLLITSNVLALPVSNGLGQKSRTLDGGRRFLVSSFYAKGSRDHIRV
jgi:hypothetical protein